MVQCMSFPFFLFLIFNDWDFLYWIKRSSLFNTGNLREHVNLELSEIRMYEIWVARNITIFLVFQFNILSWMVQLITNWYTIRNIFFPFTDSFFLSINLKLNKVTYCLISFKIKMYMLFYHKLSHLTQFAKWKIRNSI